jgi:hypothetical protein
MITTPTTFVIGAGASQPYGLPVASALRRYAANLEPRAVAYRFLVHTGIDAAALNEFLADLREHPADSIDAFLESRQDRPSTMAIGKAVIAATMGVMLSNARRATVKPEEDWLPYVIEKMRRGASTWELFAGGNAQMRFVTFNFDTVIEEKLASAVAAIYRGTDVNVEQVLSKIPIVHVHGKLPTIPNAAFDGPVAAPSPEWLTWTMQAPSRSTSSSTPSIHKLLQQLMNRCAALE